MCTFEQWGAKCLKDGWVSMTIFVCFDLEIQPLSKNLMYIQRNGEHIHSCDSFYLSKTLFFINLLVNVYKMKRKELNLFLNGM